ncbi:MAG: hypothetical protein OXI75_02870 [Rhodospirillales bacterium]|nr:hypothetical protein [Rhodospirillales bacterium]
MKEATMRALKPEFLADLKEGVLAPLTEMVKSDTSLCLELRGNYINIYYRGGSLMKVKSSRPAGTYSVSFDKNYFRYGESIRLPQRNIGSSRDVEAWLHASPRLKQGMDQHFAKRKKDEREFQQLVLRDNNFGSIAESTDYYICDIEYRSRFGQFDMIAVAWPSTPQDRRRANDRRLTFVEVKHGDKALTKGAGLHAHIRDINNYAGEVENLQKIKEDMVAVFNQKWDLNLVKCKKKLSSFSDERPCLLLALVNHDPESKILARELETLPGSPHVEVCIATASFLGYGLYTQGVHSLDEARRRFGKYINCER